jgi:hypothetical protein
MMKKLIGIACMLVALTACEKTINLAPEVQTPKLVVDGSIENGQAPLLVLSTSLGYFSTITPQQLQNSFVRNAVVEISDGTVTHRLKEYSVQIAPGAFYYYYSNDATNPATAIIGKFNTTYNLSIVYNGVTYRSTTKIPANNGRKVDSIWWKPAPNNPDTNRCVMVAKISDPPGFGNYTRYFTKVNSGPFLPGGNSVYDDQITDGTTFVAQVDQGVDRNSPPSSEDFGFFRRGDTVTIKNANIDRATYDFWRTWEFGYQNIGNPFSSPTKVLGNISNNALGAFCGYAVGQKTIVIPK